MVRLLVILLCFPVLLASQVLDKKITISIHEKTIAESIELISTQANIDYSYNANLISEEAKISGSYTGTVKEVLTDILEGQKIDFKEINGQILFYKRKEKKVVKTTNTIFGQVKNDSCHYFGLESSGPLR